MKTFVVRVGDRGWMGNAESPDEAVAFAIAYANLLADQYVVYDWNLDRTVVSRDGSADSSGDAGEPGV
jgi:hypothetical protein